MALSKSVDILATNRKEGNSYPAAAIVGGTDLSLRKSVVRREKGKLLGAGQGMGVGEI